MPYRRAYKHSSKYRRNGHTNGSSKFKKTKTYTRKFTRIPRSMRPQIKSQTHNQVTITNHIQAITQQTDVLNVVPTIAQGLTENGRIGNKLHALTLRVMGTVISDWSSDPTHFRSRQIGVRVMVVQPKRYRHWPDPYNNYSAWLALLMDNGAGGMPYIGDTNSYYAPINKDCVHVLRDKRIRLSPPVAYNDPTTGTQLEAGLKACKPFKFLIKVNKGFTYSGGADQHPSNYAPVLLMGWTYLDGSAPDAVNAVDMSFRADLWYRDA